MSIAHLNESDLLIIQDYVSNKAPHLVKEHASYTHNQKFEFLPGHRKLVLALRNKVKYFNKQNNRKPKKTPQNIPSETELIQNSEEIELLTAEEIANLKSRLNSKLANISKLTGSPAFTEENFIGTIDAYISKNLKTITSKTPSYKCFVKCVLCEKKVPCTFNKRWETSNISNHLKSHTSELSIQRELDEILDK